MAINLPHVREPVSGSDGVATRAWYAWFGRIQSALNAGTISDDEAAAAISIIATALGSPDGTVANIPPLNFLRATTYARAGTGLAASGTLANGGVEFSLDADTDLVPEGSTNLYYTNARADARIQVFKDAPALTVANLQNAVDDTAAATAGVAVGALYRNGSALMIRVA